MKCNCIVTKPIIKEISRPGLTLRISYDPQCYIFHVVGRMPGYTTIEYIAPSPMPRGYSPSKGALPFPSRLIAYENTPNQGVVKADGQGYFTINLQAPGAYFDRQGQRLVFPELILKTDHHMFIISLTDFWYNNHLQPQRHLVR